MAHEIEQTDNLALAVQPAWHGLGNVVGEAMSPAEALVKANLDWTVKFSDRLAATIRLPDQDGNMVDHVIEDTESRHLIRVAREGKFYRDGQPERHIIVGRHGKDYVPMQNSELLDLAYTFGDQVKVETCGSIKSGKQIFALLKGETLNIKGNDPVTQYLALLNGHDGSLSLSAMPTSVRIVCANTLNMALRADAKKMFRVRHGKNMEEKIKIATKALQTFQSTGNSFVEQIKALSEIEIKEQANLSKFWRSVYNKHFLKIGSGQQSDVDKAVATVIDADINELLEAVLDDAQREERRLICEGWQTTMESESMICGTEPSAWLAGNAITGWLQKREPGRKMMNWQENRMVSNAFGDNDSMSATIIKSAMSLA